MYTSKTAHTEPRSAASASDSTDSKSSGGGGASGASGASGEAGGKGTAAPVTAKPLSRSVQALAAAAIAQARGVANAASGTGIVVSSGRSSGSTSTGQSSAPVARPVAVAAPVATPTSAPTGTSGASVSGESGSSGVASAVPIAAATALVEHVFQFPSLTSNDEVRAVRRRTFLYVRDLYFAHQMATRGSAVNPSLPGKPLPLSTNQTTDPNNIQVCRSACSVG